MSQPVLFPRGRRATPVPADYTAEARQLWLEITNGWTIDPAALVLLDSACRSLMRVRQAQDLLATDGAVVRDRYGQLKAHPATTIERDATATLHRAVRSLNLDLEPLRDQPGRPPGGRSKATGA